MAHKNARIDALMDELTLDEKIKLVSGADMWRTHPIDRLHIPSMKMTDGPNGARGDSASPVTSACFPVGSALAATFNVDLIEQVGKALGQEAKSKHAQVLLGPTINIHRTPIGGRNFECYSEDPYLSARLAVHFTRGVQSERVSVCLKHFLCNDTEFERHTISCDVDERSLREIYLSPFEAAVKEASPRSVMSSYNKINGIYAASHHELLDGVLKNEWGFDGFVVSDWGGALETVENAVGGLDLEMPGPARIWGAKLHEAVDQGQVSSEVLDDKVRRLLHVMDWTGRLDDPSPEQPELSDDRPDHRALAKQAAQESMVLLKNESILPLDQKKARTVAIIGPNAKRGQVQGGGSSGVSPHYISQPLNALTQRLGGEAKIIFEPGCTTHKYLPAIEAELLTNSLDANKHGFSFEMFGNGGFGGEPDDHGIERRGKIAYFGSYARVLKGQEFSVRYKAVFTAETTGDHEFGLISAGLARMYVDGRELIDNWTSQEPGDAFYALGSAEKRGSIHFEAGKTYELQLDYKRPPKMYFPGIQVGLAPPMPDNLIGRAQKAALEADATILVIGTNSDWETEGNDRDTLALPGDQIALIDAVLEADPNTIIVVNAGSVVEMPWLARAKAVLFAWFAGQEFGNGLMDLIFGDASPSGKLPLSFPKRIEDTPAYTHYPGKDGHMPYGEGLFVGYRWYDAQGIKPLFPFGYGLTYSSFDINIVRIVDQFSSGKDVKVNLSISNTGKSNASEVVQLYVHDLEASLERPLKELKGFQKVFLKAGETKDIAITLSPRAFAFWHPEHDAFVVEPGQFEILIGTSSENIAERAQIQYVGRLTSL